MKRYLYIRISKGVKLSMMITCSSILGHGGGLATPESNFKGPYDVLRSIYRQHGIRGCYKGLACMTMR